jgi:hypothetical protein
MYVCIYGLCEKGGGMQDFCWFTNVKILRNTALNKIKRVCQNVACSLTYTQFLEGPHILHVQMIGVSSNISAEAVRYPVRMLMCQPVPDVLSFT